MKKIFVMLILSTALVGCSNGNTNQGTTTNQGTEPVEEIDIIEEEPVMSEEGVLGGKYKVKFGTAEKVTSEYVEGDLLLVNYTFTNNSEETVAADMVLMIDAYQDGVEIDQVFDVTLTGDNANKNIKPGNSLECKALFILSSASDVEVDATEFLGMDGSMVTKIYTLQ